MKIIACNSNKILAEAISSYIGVKLANASLRRFADREIFVEINENIRGEDVFIIQSTSHPANDHLMELLLTMPISLWHCIIGKFLASWIFLTLALALTFPIWITVNYLGDPDNNVVLASYIGSFFLAGAYLSVTSMTSAFTRNQVISFILSVVICLFLILCGFPPVTDVVETIAPRWIVEFTAAFSVMPNIEQFNNGQIDSRSVIYFLSVIGFPLFATSVIIRGLRA